MKIRDIRLNEMAECLKIGCAHPDNRNIPGGLSTDYFIKRFIDLYVAGIARMFGMFTPVEGRLIGAFGFFVVPDIFNGDKVALENFWFIFPEFRGRGVVLLKEYERQARMLGCVRIQMPHQVKRQDAGFGKFLTRYGFELNESSYMKTLNE